MSRVEEKVKLAKGGEQPGFFGLGKYEVDRYTREDIRRRVSTLIKSSSESPFIFREESAPSSNHVINV